MLSHPVDIFNMYGPMQRSWFTVLYEKTEIHGSSFIGESRNQLKTGATVVYISRLELYMYSIFMAIANIRSILK